MAGLIVHEWLSKSGGSENVYAAMAESFPDADLFCLWDDDRSRFGARRAQESWLAATPLRGRKMLALPFMPGIWRNLRGGNRHEWLLASSHLFAHQARFAQYPDVPKFVYVHTPARYIWNPELDRRGKNPFAQMSAPLLKSIDHRFAQDSSKIAANSEYVRKRIATVWQRDSRVIYPPVDVEKIQRVSDWEASLNARELEIVASLPSIFILGASRFVPYKKLDDVIAVGEENDVCVVLAGSGPEEAKLRHLGAAARVPVKFILAPSDALLYVLYRKALVYVFPAVEDFGIMPVEAMAAGAKVVVNARGGAKESVVHGLTGTHVQQFSGSEIRRAVEISAGLSSRDCEVRAREFSTERFGISLKTWMLGPESFENYRG